MFVKSGWRTYKVLATGAIPCIPDIPGVNGSNVATAIDVLTGKKETGQRVVIIGGGSVGCETAEFLAKKGKQVTILEMLGRIGADYGPMNRWVVIDRLLAEGVRMEANARAEEITEKGVWIIRQGVRSEFFEADTVVIAVGMVSSNGMEEELKGKVDAVCQVGDSVKPAQVQEAVEGGFKAALEI